MLRMLDLICTLLKWSLVVTLVRLVGTAFGLEFGVSRQYLRLLEWLLEEGQARVERVESRDRLRLEHQLRQQLEVEPNVAPTSPPQPPANLELDKRTAQRQRKVSILDGHFEINYSATQTNGLGNGALADSPTAALNGNGPHQRRRRVSTPDGPPVFLLDESDRSSDSADSTAADEKENRARQHQRHEHHRHEFHLDDAARFVIRGVEAVVDDEVTKRFTPEELKTWNLLTRTNAKNYQFKSRSLGICWLLGLVARYALLLPLRIVFTLAGSLWLVCSMTLIGLAPRSLRARPYKLVSLMSFRMLSCGITSRLKFHNRQYRAKQGDVCVANHTSPLDVVLLACDNCYALVGQRHAGLLGLLESALSRATRHVWFDRAEMRDRQLVTRRLREHVGERTNLPILIFPEGTCINNSAVMMFRKGAFETTDRVCPVAIKYDPRFGDPFWNSSKQSYVHYLLMMMSSWAIKCDVWYLPPMERRPGESSAEFANRVKAEIAKQGGLVDLAWDGQLKRTSVKPTWLYQQQEDYVKRLKLE